MTKPPFHSLPSLAVDGVAHGFFSRLGGVSTGVFQSLNTGPGSGDDQNHVAENRQRCLAGLGASHATLLTNTQIHSAKVEIVDAPWTDMPPEADGLASKEPGLALGVLTADCMPWLFVDPVARVIGAAHAGWRGTLAGVLENTISAMVSLGAVPKQIKAGLGPCLRQQNFEVGLDLYEQFLDRHEDATAFFASGRNLEKRQFDLAGFGKQRLEALGVEAISDTELCTLDQHSAFFSYRHSRRADQNDYGRNLSAIIIL